MSSIRFEFNRDAIRHAALTSPEVRAAVKAKAEAIAARARGATDDRIVVNDGGRSRARSYVVRLDGGAAAEASDRAMGRSVSGA